MRKQQVVHCIALLQQRLQLGRNGLVRLRCARGLVPACKRCTDLVAIVRSTCGNSLKHVYTSINLCVYIVLPSSFQSARTTYQRVSQVHRLVHAVCLQTVHIQNHRQRQVCWAMQRAPVDACAVLYHQGAHTPSYGLGPAGHASMAGSHGMPTAAQSACSVASGVATMSSDSTTTGCLLQDSEQSFGGMNRHVMCHESRTAVAELVRVSQFKANENGASALQFA